MSCVKACCPLVSARSFRQSQTAGSRYLAISEPTRTGTGSSECSTRSNSSEGLPLGTTKPKDPLPPSSISRPHASGSAHIVLERFLQVRGSQDGWAYLLEFGANLYTLTARSFTVLEGVSSGRFNIGITIDFLAHLRSDGKNTAHIHFGTPRPH